MPGRKRQVVLYGPLPPPYGGVRVSFEMLYRHIAADNSLDVHLVNVPVRSSSDGSVSNLRTASQVLRSLRQLVKADRVLVAGSRNFGFGYGGLIALICWLVGVPSSIRFYGGRPFQGVAKLPRLLQLLAIRALGLHSCLSVETDVGREEFPEPLRERILVHYGHRYVGELPLARVNDPSIVRFVYVGQVSSAKGIDLLVATASRIASKTGEHFELHLFGQVVDDIEFPDEGWLTIHGPVPNQELIRRLPEFDIMVFPTAATSEGHPGALIEAMLAGLPIVASDLPTIREIVTDGHSGLLIPMGDGQALELAMLRMFDPNLRRKLSSAVKADSAKLDAALILPSLASNLGVYE